MAIHLKYAHSFLKSYQKRIAHEPKLVKQVKKRIEFFVYNPSHPLLRDHALKGSRQGDRSFSITGDCRIIYKYIDDTTIVLLDIGTHNQVY